MRRPGRVPTGRPCVAPFSLRGIQITKKNMCTIDRTIRVVLAVVVGILYMMGQISGTAAVILGLFAVIFLLTSAVGFSPLFVPLGISMVRENKRIVRTSYGIHSCYTKLYQPDTKTNTLIFFSASLHT